MLGGEIGPNSVEIGSTNTEFRDRSQTAPILLRRHRERNNMTIEHKDNNNTEGKFYFFTFTTETSQIQRDF